MIFLATGFWHKLDQADKWLFQLINTQWSNPLFDQLMPYLRNPNLWPPLYLFLLVLVLQHFRIRGAWWCLFFLVTVALTDMTGTYLFKHNIQRIRPCNDPEFFQYVRLLLPHCSGGYSFTSNHAANHSGMAAFFLFTFHKQIGKWAFAGIFWALLIAFAQVYVGVHYPGDVLGGAMLGLLLGGCMALLFNKRFGFAIFEQQPTSSI